MDRIQGLFLFFILACGFGSPLWAEEAPMAPADPVAYVVEDIQGSQVQVLEDGAKDWAPAEEGQVLETGDEIKVGAESEATLMLQGETSVHLDENSGFKVEEVSGNGTGGFVSRLKFLAGHLLADVKKNLDESRSTFEIETNGVVCGVRGTAFELNQSGEGSDLSVQEGKVETTGKGDTRMVGAGNFSSFRLGRFLLMRRLEKREGVRFLRWREFRKKVFQKRLQRLEDIRKHRRKPWRRRHARLKRAMLRHMIRANNRP